MKTYRLSALLLLAFVAACSKQGEGDTCTVSNGSGDCESGLVCTKADDLVSEVDSGPYKADRCCPDPKDRISSNSLCKLVGSTEDTGNGGAGGAAGASSTSEGGSSGASTSSSTGGATSAGGSSAGGTSATGGTSAVGGASSSGT